jgi:membrane fusion protein, multidrug efflux system
MSRRALAGVGLLLIVAVIAAWRLGITTEPPAAKALEAPPEVPVTPGIVTARDVPEYLQGIGTVQPFNTVAVKSRVDGPIVKVAFTEGQEVKQGDLLLQIDPRPYQAALELAQATKTKDEAQLQTAEADLERYSRLVGSGFQTRQSFDQQKGLVAQLMATIKGDEAQIDTAQLNLGFTDIRSPITGRLGARLIDIGNLVHANDNTALVTVSQLQPIFVSFTLPQASLERIRRNQQQGPLEVVALSDDAKTQIAAGQLTLIDNAIDEATGTIHLKATFANSDESLWPGEFVNTRLVLRMRHNVPTVPSQAVQPGPNGYFAYVIGPNDTVKRQAVEVATMQDGLAVINKGLTVGERIVVAGQYRLTDGARVKLVAGKPAETAQQ